MTPARPAGTPAGRRAGSTPGSVGGAARLPPAPRRPDADAPSTGTGTPAGPVRLSQEADRGAVTGPGTASDPAIPPVADPGPVPVRRGAPWWALAVTAAAAVVAVAALVVVLVARPSQTSLRDSALLAGRSYVTDLTTYDARTFDADVAKVKKVSTPEFAKEYDASIAKVRDSIVKAQTVATGTVVAAGVEKLSNDGATVLVAVNQAFQAPGQQARTEANRVRVVLARRGGNWYLSGVTRL